MAGPGDNANKALLRFVERVERLTEERQGLSEDIREVLTEAKDSGFDAKIIRKAIQARKDYAAWKEGNQLLATYLDALDQAELSERRQSEEDGA